MDSHFTMPPGPLPVPNGAAPEMLIPLSAGLRLRITKLIRCAGTALCAAMVCLPMLLAPRPKTPLRVLGIAVFEYLTRLRGGTLGKGRRLAVAQA